MHLLLLHVQMAGGVAAVVMVTQAGPGEFGYYPIVDRSGGGGMAGPARPAHYFQVVIAEPDALSGIPEYVIQSSVRLIMFYRFVLCCLVRCFAPCLLCRTSISKRSVQPIPRRWLDV